ncbi:MAG: septum formation initiator family protein [Myxococcota bacterium]
MKALTLGTFVIAAIALSALLDEDTGVAIWRELRRDLDTANARVEQLMRENDALRSEIVLLESEPAALDRAIREELDLVRPGEVVVRFEPTQTGNVEGRASAAAASGLRPSEVERRARSAATREGVAVGDARWKGAGVGPNGVGK